MNQRPQQEAKRHYSRLAQAVPSAFRNFNRQKQTRRLAEMVRFPAEAERPVLALCRRRLAIGLNVRQGWVADLSVLARRVESFVLRPVCAAAWYARLHADGEASALNKT